jgi:hypothetical protein
MPNKVSHPYGDQTLQLVGEAAREFHLALLQWIAHVRGPVSLTSPLRHAMRRARVALEMAAHSRSYEGYLKRAREDLLMCRAQFIVLADEGYFTEEHFRDARSRLAQILRGVDQLIITPIENWDELKLMPIEPEPAAEASAAQAKREALRQRVAEIANLTRYFPDATAHPSLRRRGRSAAPLPSAPPPKSMPG